MPEKAPAISKEIVEYLERIIPDKCPDPDVPVDQVRYESGRVSVVRLLRKLHERQLTQVLR